MSTIILCGFFYFVFLFSSNRSNFITVTIIVRTYIILSVCMQQLTYTISQYMIYDCGTFVPISCNQKSCRLSIENGIPVSNPVITAVATAGSMTWNNTFLNTKRNDCEDCIVFVFVPSESAIIYLMKKLKKFRKRDELFHVVE